jgi:hypothetical protein
MKKIVVGLILASVVVHDSKAVLPLAIPVVAAIELITVDLVANAGAAMAVSALAYKVNQITGNPAGSALGSIVNSVKIWTQGQSSSSPPTVQVSVDPKSVPSGVPSNWSFDFASGIAFDPLVNSAPGALLKVRTDFANERCHSLYDGASGPQDVTVSVAPTAYYCLYRGNVIAGADFESSVGAGLKPEVNKSSPPKFPSDGRCSLVRVSNSFASNPQDPDCGSGSPNPGPGISFTPNQITGDNGSGSSTNVIINPDGSTRVVSRSPSASGTQTIENILDLSAPLVGANSPSVAVQGQKTNVYDGIGTSTSPTPISSTIPVPPSVTPSDATAPPSSSDGAKEKTLEAVKSELEKIADETVPIVPGLPTVPKFYERSYPEGFKTVWDKHSSALQNTSMFRAVGRFVPSWGGGQCPSFRINLSLSEWANYGAQDISIPCTVWDIVGALTMLSAVFAARRIIFGG